MSINHYRIIERLHDRDTVPVYRRFRENGRLKPDGFEHISSWVTADVRSCYQIMATDDPNLMEELISHCSDFVNFEILPSLALQRLQRALGFNTVLVKEIGCRP